MLCDEQTPIIDKGMLVAVVVETVDNANRLRKDGFDRSRRLK